MRVKAALFSCSGQVLWISREFPQDMRRLSQPDPWHEVLAFTTHDYQLLGRVAVRGEVQAGHTLAAHPNQDTLAVEVSCGQDGSWITFASVQTGQVTQLAPHIDGDSDPFSLAGFAPDGAALITTGESVIEEFQWPSCQSSAKAQANSDEDEGEGELYYGTLYSLVQNQRSCLGSVGADLCVCPGRTHRCALTGYPTRLSGNALGPDLLIADGSGGLRAWRVTGK